VKKIILSVKMHTLQSTMDFRVAASSPTLPILKKSSETLIIDDKSLEKPRSPSANSSSSSPVKPPYSYIALSNYHFLSHLRFSTMNQLKFIFFSL
jgi:hypothetical protein